MKLSKKDIRLLILYTVVLVFAFIYIKELFNIVAYIIKIFMPFIIGICIAFVLNVLMNEIEKKWFVKLNVGKDLKRALSLVLSLLIVLGVIILVLVIIIPNLEDTIKIFASTIPSYVNNLSETLTKLNIDESLVNNIISILNALGGYASDYVIDNSETLIAATFGIAQNVLSGLFNLLIGIVFAIYYLFDKEKITNNIKDIMNAYLPKSVIEKVNNVAILSNKVFSSFVSGQCIEALIIGILCFIGMIILRLPYAGAISVLVGFTALIPVFGAFIGTIFGAFLIFMINPIQAIIFIIYIIVLQQLEGNLIYPHVVGKSVGLPGIWVLVAVSVGASINGVLGMLLSVPIVSIIYSIVKTDVNKAKIRNNKRTKPMA